MPWITVSMLSFVKPCAVTAWRPFSPNSPPCLIGIEACGSAHYWARELTRMGHTVRIIPPRLVKPYLKGQKNDANDAEAICEAVSRPGMRFVAIRTERQQTLQAEHRVRARLIRARTALSNEIRGLLGGVRCGVASGNSATA
ncbi:transposase, IS110 family [Klebsiella oxytoca]|nr:transposase, IS110 family [Klebsiella oxytoca]